MKRLTITGNLGRDPELRCDSQGNQFATFSVAVAVGVKNNPKTDWVEVSCNGKLVDIVMSYAKKGNKVLVEGFPAVGVYYNQENQPVASQRLYAHTLEILNRIESDVNPDIIQESHLFSATEEASTTHAEA